jgi:anaerobic selenocysteine-containing dehydrogenase
MQWSPPVITPVGESRANHAVIADLGRRLGIVLTDTEDDLAQRVLNALPSPIPLERLKDTRAEPVPAPVQFVDTTTRIHLVGDAPPDYKPAPVDRERTFILISPASTRGISSTLFEALPPGEATVCVHPDDMVETGLTQGSAARVFNSVGECVLKVEADPTLRRGVVLIPKGLWGRSTLNGRTANALVPDHVDEAGGGACYNDARVDLSPANG